MPRFAKSTASISNKRDSLPADPGAPAPAGAVPLGRDAALRIRLAVPLFGERTLALLLLAPSLVVTVALVLYPLSEGVLLSLQSATLLGRTREFVGLANFEALFRNPDYWNALWNTIVWTFGSGVLQHLVGLALALLLNTRLRGAAFYRSVFLLPWICPLVVFALVWRWLYSDLYGIINYILLELSLIREPVLWLGSKTTAMWASIVAATWRGFPLPMIFLLARLQAIPAELYEAAAIDGASRWRAFTAISLPAVKYTLAASFLITAIWTFNNFGTMYLLTGGGPSRATETLAILTYRKVFADMQMGQGAAMAMTMMGFLGVLAALYFRWLRAEGEE